MEAGTGQHGDGGLGGILLQGRRAAGLEGRWQGRCAVMEG